MIIFEYSAFILFAVFTFLCGFTVIQFIRYKHLIKLTKLHILRRQQKQDVSFYADDIIEKCVKILFFKRSKPAKKALAELVCGKINSAENIIAQKHRTTALFLRAHHDINSAYRELKKSFKNKKNNTNYLLLFADLALRFFDYDKARTIIKRANYKRIRGVYRALYDQISAVVYIRDADMLSASSNASKALKYFQKHDMPIKEAETYLILGEIYRMSCVNDVAQTMIESAVKIYDKFNFNLFKARAVAILGMLMVFENRMEEAADKFDSALQSVKLNQTKAEILNQVALMNISENNVKKSFKNATDALKLHQKQKNKRGIALSLQILAHLHYAKNHLHKTVDCAEKAILLYLKQKNFSAVCECLYLQATVFFKQAKTATAEKILRRILKISEQHDNNFHYANAYSLLGLIYLQKNDLQRAKVLIQQSLHLEQRNDRAFGMIVDYANLSLIENMRGDKTSAAANLQTALEYALKTENEDLINLIKERI